MKKNNLTLILLVAGLLVLIFVIVQYRSTNKQNNIANTGIKGTVQGVNCSTSPDCSRMQVSFTSLNDSAKTTVIVAGDGSFAQPLPEGEYSVELTNIDNGIALLQQNTTVAANKTENIEFSVSVEQ